jgi:hypothetical protein
VSRGFSGLTRGFSGSTKGEEMNLVESGLIKDLSGITIISSNIMLPGWCTQVEQDIFAFSPQDYQCLAKCKTDKEIRAAIKNIKIIKTKRPKWLSSPIQVKPKPQDSQI